MSLGHTFKTQFWQFFGFKKIISKFFVPFLGIGRCTEGAQCLWNADMSCRGRQECNKMALFGPHSAVVGVSNFDLNSFALTFWYIFFYHYSSHGEKVKSFKSHKKRRKKIRIDIFLEGWWLLWIYTTCQWIFSIIYCWPKCQNAKW